MKFVNDGRHILSRDYMNLKVLLPTVSFLSTFCFFVTVNFACQLLSHAISPDLTYDGCCWKFFLQILSRNTNFSFTHQGIGKKKEKRIPSGFSTIWNIQTSFLSFTIHSASYTVYSEKSLLVWYHVFTLPVLMPQCSNKSNFGTPTKSFAGNTRC